MSFLRRDHQKAGQRDQWRSVSAYDKPGSIKFDDIAAEQAFEVFDLNHNKYISAAEIKHILFQLGEHVTSEEVCSGYHCMGYLSLDLTCFVFQVDEMVRMIDTDGNREGRKEGRQDLLMAGVIQPTSSLDADFFLSTFFF